LYAVNFEDERENTHQYLMKFPHQIGKTGGGKVNLINRKVKSEVNKKKI
jgi:hypothetical protein